MTARRRESGPTQFIAPISSSTRCDGRRTPTLLLHRRCPPPLCRHHRCRSGSSVATSACASFPPHPPPSPPGRLPPPRHQFRLPPSPPCAPASSRGPPPGAAAGGAATSTPAGGEASGATAFVASIERQKRRRRRPFPAHPPPSGPHHPWLTPHPAPRTHASGLGAPIHHPVHGVARVVGLGSGCDFPHPRLFPSRSGGVFGGGGFHRSSGTSRRGGGCRQAPLPRRRAHGVGGLGGGWSARGPRLKSRQDAPRAPGCYTSHK